MELVRQTDENAHTNGDLDSLDIPSEENSPQHVPTESVRIIGIMIFILMVSCVNFRTPY